MSKTLTLEKCKEIMDNFKLYTDGVTWGTVTPEEWTNIMNNCRLDDYIDENGSLVIPEGIVSIPAEMFIDNQELKSITIPASVYEIGYSAFECCSNLTEIKGATDLIIIGDNALPDEWLNKQLDGVVYVGSVAYTYKGEMPENGYVEIKEGTLGIANDAFKNREDLVQVKMPDSLIVVGHGAFENCTNLEKAKMPDDLVTIGISAYRNCTNLDTKVPEQLRYLNSLAFEGCNSLKEPIVLVEADFIGDSAFENCSNIKSVNIGCHFTEIHNSAFRNCINLDDVNFTGKIKEMKSHVFDNCENLKNINFNEKNDYIKEKIKNEYPDIAITKASKNITANELENDEGFALTVLKQWEDNIGVMQYTYNNTKLISERVCDADVILVYAEQDEQRKGIVGVEFSQNETGFEMIVNDFDNVINKMNALATIDELKNDFEFSDTLDKIWEWNIESTNQFIYNKKFFCEHLPCSDIISVYQEHDGKYVGIMTVEFEEKQDRIQVTYTPLDDIREIEEIENKEYVGDDEPDH